MIDANAYIIGLWSKLSNVPSILFIILTIVHMIIIVLRCVFIFIQMLVIKQGTYAK